MLEHHLRKQLVQLKRCSAIVRGYVAGKFHATVKRCNLQHKRKAKPAAWMSPLALPAALENTIDVGRWNARLIVRDLNSNASIFCSDNQGNGTSGQRELGCIQEQVADRNPDCFSHAEKKDMRRNVD